MYAQVVEYGPPTVLPLDAAQAAAIRAAGARWAKALRLGGDPFKVEMTSAGCAIRALDVAGFIRIGELSLDVVPKFLDPESAGPTWRRALWRLLAFAQGVDSIVIPTSGREVDKWGIADLLADLFIASVGRAVLMGYPLGYQTQRRLCPFMTGRIDPRRAGRLAIPDGQLPIETKRLTRDTDLGRLLKWAGRELSRLVESSERRGRLRAWTGGLPDISDTPRTLLRSVSMSRQFPHLKVAVDIARMLLADRWGEYGNGPLNLPGFLWRSETLFEKAMLRLARQSAHPLGMTADKKAHPLAILRDADGKRTVPTTPDIDVHRAGNSVAILDAKYKVLNILPSAVDVYQVLSAGRVCGVHRVGLLYPSEGSGLQLRTLSPLGEGLPRTVDLIAVGFQSFESFAKERGLRSQLTSWIRESAELQATA